MMIGPKTSEAALEARAIRLGLDKPFYVQYFVWLMNVLRKPGLFGQELPAVSEIIGNHLGPTLLLMGTSLLLGLAIAIPIGIYSAVQVHKAGLCLVTISFFGTSVPSFSWRLSLYIYSP